jgi:hypothetical protein
LTLPLAGTSPTTSSSSEGPASPPAPSDSIFDHDTSKSAALSNDVDALRLLLQEVSAECIAVLRCSLVCLLTIKFVFTVLYVLFDWRLMFVNLI